VILAACLLLVSFQSENAARIKIGPNVAVNKDEPLKMHTEVVLAVNPMDSRNIVAASNRSWGDAKTKACVVLVYTSQDGGTTWETIPFETDRGSFRGDPCIVFGADGTAYLGTIAVGGTGTIASSKDKGRTWQRGSNSSMGDHSRLALDPRTGHLFRDLREQRRKAARAQVGRLDRRGTLFRHADPGARPRVRHGVGADVELSARDGRRHALRPGAPRG
jgi:photosystem II stability/assembly factor-like uncharacterized protein